MEKPKWTFWPTPKFGECLWFHSCTYLSCLHRGREKKAKHSNLVTTAALTNCQRVCQTLCVHINIYYLCTHTYVISFNSYEKLLKKFIRRNQSWKNLSNLPKLSLWFLLGFVWLQSVYQCSCDIVFQYRFIHNSQGLCIHLLLLLLLSRFNRVRLCATP